MMTSRLLTAIPLHPQFDFGDSALDEVSRLFDGDWVWQEFLTRFGERSGTPHRIGVRQFSHDPGRRALVSYVAEWPPDDFIPDEQFAFEVRCDRDMSVYRYPEDPHLPGLIKAASVESALKLVNRHVMAMPAHRVRVDMVRYRPGNRAVLRHRFGRFGFYVRVMRPAALGPFPKAARLVQHSGFVAPRIAGCWEAGGVVWLSEILGRNLRRYIHRDKRPPAETLLDGLEALWSVPLGTEGTHPFNLEGAYRRAKRAFRKALVDDEKARGILGDAVRSLDQFVRSWERTHTAHNDFYDDQMLILPDGRIALVDFEEAGPGDPLLDVGNFLAHLRWAALFRRGREAAAKSAYHEIFRGAALERMGWDGQELTMREAVCLFRVCTNAIRHPRPDWRQRLEEGLTLVNEILE